jgi:hypothetical protein
MVAAAVVRLRLASTDVDVVLGGGVFQARDRVFLGRIRAGISAVAPASNVITLAVPPIVGALLLGLDAVGASARADARLRAAFADGGFPRAARRPAPAATRSARRA